MSRFPVLTFCGGGFSSWWMWKRTASLPFSWALLSVITQFVFLHPSLWKASDPKPTSQPTSSQNEFHNRITFFFSLSKFVFLLFCECFKCQSEGLLTMLLYRYHLSTHIRMQTLIAATFICVFMLHHPKDGSNYHTVPICTLYIYCIILQT